MKLFACLALAVLIAASTRAADTNAPVPSANYEVRAQAQPIIQRGFMPESSPRSIAVGLPGGLSYCFDTETCRLRYAWSGGFLNMKPTWHARGAQPPELRGAKFFVAPDTIPIHFGERAAAPKLKFVGYALVNHLPEFRFSVDDVAVKQRVEPAPGGGLRSTFELRGATNAIFFPAPNGVRVSAAGRELARDEAGWVRLPRGSPLQFEAWIPGPASAKPDQTATRTSNEK